jgi:hypothetical protein
LSITVNVILSQPGSIAIGLIILAAGYPMFLVMRRVSSKRRSTTEGVEETLK